MAGIGVDTDYQYITVTSGAGVGSLPWAFTNSLPGFISFSSNHVQVALLEVSIQTGATKLLFINSDVVMGNVIVGDQSTNNIRRLTVAPSTQVTYEPYMLHWFDAVTIGNTLSQISVTITDSNGTLQTDLGGDTYITLAFRTVEN